MFFMKFNDIFDPVVAEVFTKSYDVPIIICQCEKNWIALG